MTTDFGVDVATSDDLDVSGANTSGKKTLAENLIRRSTTPAGLLEYATENDSFDIREYWSADMGDAELNALAAAAEAAYLSDERVSDASVVATLKSGKLELAAAIVPSDEEPFKLVISTDSVTTESFLVG